MSGSQPGAEESAVVETSSTPADAGNGGGETAAVASNTAETPAGETAGSPPAPDARPKTLLEATKLAIGHGASSSSEGEKKEGQKPNAEAVPGKPGGADAAAGATEDDKNKPPPFHEHPRWQEKQRQVKTLETNLAELKPRAESFDEITRYMEQNRLSTQDVQNGFAIMAALKTDPARAWQLLEPLVANVRQHLGHDLPPDLQAKVEEGSVDEATAKELARARNQTRFIEARQQDERAAQQRQSAAQVNAQTVNAVNTWATQKQQADPDFAKIEPLLHGTVLQLQREWQAANKSFASPQAAVALTSEAYERVRKSLQAARPRAPVVPPRSGNTSTAATPARPATLKDAIRAALK
jgi:hypothetical protein